MIFTLASNTILETVRRRIVAIVGTTSLLCVVALGWAFHRLGEAIQPQSSAIAVEAILTILFAFAFSVVLGVGASFLSAPAIGSDIDSGVALAILARPISRTSYVLGKWLGLATLLVVFALGFGFLAFTAIALRCGYHVPHEGAALAYLTAQSLVLFSLAIALSTRLVPIAGGIVAVFCFGISWIAGITAVIADSLKATLLAHIASIVGLVIPSDGLWRGAVFELTPATMLAAQQTMHGGVNPFSVTDPPTPAFAIWSGFWLLGVLAVAVASLRTRDI